MNKKILIILLVAVVLGIAGYFYYLEWSKSPAEKAAEEAAKSLEKALKSAGAGTLPEVGSSASEAIGDKLQEINPVTKTNPFK